MTVIEEKSSVSVSFRLSIKRVTGSGFAALLTSGFLLAVLALSWSSYDTWVEWVVGMTPDRIIAITRIDTMLIATSWVVGAILFAQLFNGLVWRGLVERVNGRPVPRLLIGLFNGLLTLVALIGILMNAFDVGWGVLLAIFGSLFLLVTIFLRKPLEDMFAGLSLQLDPTIGIGDVIRLPEGETGIIEDTTWRSTRLRTLDGETVLAPNSQIASTTITRISGTGETVPEDIRLTLDFTVGVDRAIRVLGAAARSAAGEAGVTDTPPPEATALETGTNGIVYQLRYYKEPGAEGSHSARTAVIRQVMVHLFNSGLAIAQPKQNVFLGRARFRQLDWMTPADRSKLIVSIPIFSPLHDDEAAQVAESLVMHRYNPGDVIIEQGSDGDSMFGLTEGLLEVLVDHPEEDGQISVARLDPGAFFGEMSLLVGEPRSATIRAMAESVVYEIRRDTIMELLETRPEIGTALSEVIARRNYERSSMIEDSTRAEREAAIAASSRTLFARMRSVFGSVLGRPELRSRSA